MWTSLIRGAVVAFSVWVTGCGETSLSGRQPVPLYGRDLELIKPGVLISHHPIHEAGLGHLQAPQETVWVTVVVPTPAGKHIETAYSLIGDRAHLADRIVDSHLWTQSIRLDFTRNSRDVADFLRHMGSPDELARAGYHAGREVSVTFDPSYILHRDRYWLLKYDDGSFALLEPFTWLADVDTEARQILLRARLTTFLDVYLRHNSGADFETLSVLKRSTERKDIDRSYELETAMEEHRRRQLVNPQSLLAAKGWFDIIYVTDHMSMLEEKIERQRRAKHELGERIQSLITSIEQLKIELKSTISPDETSRIERRLLSLEASLVTNQRELNELNGRLREADVELRQGYAWRTYVAMPLTEETFISTDATLPQ